MKLLVLVQRGIHGLAAVTLCMLAAACTHADGAGSSLEQSIAVAAPPAASGGSLGPTSSSSHPIVSLDAAAGRVTAVRTRDYVDGVRQDIVLDGGAVKSVRNGITVLARTSMQQTLDEAVPLGKPSESAIRSEIGAAFPHIGLQIVEREASNAYGPYGLALGRVGSDARCLYMWQWIDTNRLPQQAGVAGPVSVRVRLCRTGTTFDAMASLMDHLMIGGSTEVVPDEVTASIPPKVVDHKVAHRLSRPAVAHQTPAPNLAAPPSVASAPLPTDLPPQAYLGPKAFQSPSPPVKSVRSF